MLSVSHAFWTSYCGWFNAGFIATMYSLEPDSQCSCWCDLEMIQCQLHWRMGFHRNVLQECASSRNFNQRGDLRARRYFLLGRGTGECRCIFDAEAVLTFVSCLAKLVFQERCDISFLCFFFFSPRSLGCLAPSTAGGPICGGPTQGSVCHASRQCHISPFLAGSVLGLNRTLKNGIKPTIFHGMRQELGMACAVAGCREWLQAVGP